MSENELNPAELLQQNGRHLATKFLSQAIKTSKNPEQINNQLHLLDCMAVHILATNIYNRMKNFSKKRSELILECKELIDDELEALFQHESNMTTLKPENNHDGA